MPAVHLALDVATGDAARCAGLPACRHLADPGQPQFAVAPAMQSAAQRRRPLTWRLGAELAPDPPHVRLGDDPEEGRLGRGYRLGSIKKEDECFVIRPRPTMAPGSQAQHGRGNASRLSISAILVSMAPRRAMLVASACATEAPRNPSR
jgi:hypothetical protein